MSNNHRKIILLLFSTWLFLWATSGSAQPYQSEAHVKVVMRMIGHQMLLLSDDSTSRVLPIQKIEDRYRVQFESEFSFEPTELVLIINTVINESKIAPRYLIEVEDCNTNEVVYSYEVNASDQSDVIPCRGREQPTSCYQLFFTILPPNKTEAELNLDSQTFSNQRTESSPPNTENDLYWFIALGLFLGMGLFFFWRKKSKRKTGPEIIKIGAYKFDKLNMQLSFKNETTELSGKEADLLFLLYTSANTTLERENILKVVWGDDGDYVGRTMDVFISKLRKKLASDSNLKIINIRGIGYKLVVNE